MKRRGWGILLIFVGVLALVQSLGYNLGLSLGSLLLMLLGGAILWSSFSKVSWFGMGLGLWVGAIGLFEILHRAGVTAISKGDIVRAWPMLLIGLGVGLLVGKPRWRRYEVHEWGCSGPWCIGDMKYGQDFWSLDGDLHLDLGIGDLQLDLSTADISEGVHQIFIESRIGDVVVRVPDGISAEVDVKVGLGDLDVFSEHRDGISPSLRKAVMVPESSIELQIQIRLSLGEVRVVRVPARHRMEDL